ncbi:MAG: NYN domain-containing protein [Acidobacteria bacterium]|nr:NYN domain-containing protein [Acidobacteriota bacterium]MBS1867905.1 NYN domain-containing protein [Acidobacteriota bacterium]
MDIVRVRIFIDFWNFQLQWNNHHGGQGTSDVVRIPWRDSLPNLLSAEASKGQTAKYLGTHVYASIDPGNPRDSGLRKFLQVLDSFPGYKVTVKDRKPASVVRCPEPKCGHQIQDCPKCGNTLRRTIEKGVDTSVLTDLIQYAFDDNFDRAVLVSADADFVPAVEYIQKKTDKQIIQAYFKSKGAELRNACWDHVFFEDLLDRLVPRPKP